MKKSELKQLIKEIVTEVGTQFDNSMYRNDQRSYDQSSEDPKPFKPSKRPTPDEAKKVKPILRNMYLDRQTGESVGCMRISGGYVTMQTRTHGDKHEVKDVPLVAFGYFYSNDSL